MLFSYAEQPFFILCTKLLSHDGKQDLYALVWRAHRIGKEGTKYYLTNIYLTQLPQYQLGASVQLPASCLQAVWHRVRHHSCLYRTHFDTESPVTWGNCQSWENGTILLFSHVIYSYTQMLLLAYINYAWQWACYGIFMLVSNALWWHSNP